ncbi:MAG: glycosyltransferase, partial [Porticoccaceae bacterium]
AWMAALPGTQAVVAVPAAVAPDATALAVADAAVMAVPAGAGFESVLAAVQARFPGRDIAYVRAGADLAPDWVALLASAAAGDDRIGAVAPLCDALALFSPFAGARPGWVDADQVRRWLPRLSRNRVFEIPALLPVCGYFRGAALAVLAAAGELTDGGNLADRFRARGWSCVACDWVFAGWPGGRLEVPLPPEDADIREFLSHHPLDALRQTVAAVLSGGAAVVPPAAPALKPVQLHVTHSWGGGLGRWVRDMCAADAERHNLVLRSSGDWSAFGYRLVLCDAAGTPLREWLLDFPIRSVAATHYHYRQVLAEVVREFQVDVVIVSSLIGHALDALATGLPTLMVQHDYFPFCPALSIHFGELCARCDGGRLRACFADNPLNRFFADSAPDHWLAIRRRWVELLHAPGVALVAPGAAVLRNLRALAPELALVPSAVVPNGTEPLGALRGEPDAGRLRLVVLGSLAPQKGAEILRQALPALTEFADVHLLGTGDEGRGFEGLPGVQVVREYQLAELPTRLAAIAPHAGLLLSIVPETFSYTLSELWMLGVPPVATRVGAFADRIEHGRTGWLIEPDAAALVAQLRTLDAERAALTSVRNAITALPGWSRADMVRAYHRLTPLPATAGLPGPGPAVAGPERPPRLRSGSLAIDPEAPARQVAADFLDYLLGKVAATRRLGRPGRWLAALPLRAARRLLSR